MFVVGVTVENQNIITASRVVSFNTAHESNREVSNSGISSGEYLTFGISSPLPPFAKQDQIDSLLF